MNCRMIAFESLVFVSHTTSCCSSIAFLLYFLSPPPCLCHVSAFRRSRAAIREATLVMLATIFLIGGLLLPPIWLLVCSFLVACALTLALSIDHLGPHIHEEIKKRIPWCVPSCCCNRGRFFLKSFPSFAIGLRFYKASEFLLRLRELPFVFLQPAPVHNAFFQILSCCVYIAALIIAAVSAHRYAMQYSILHQNQPDMLHIFACKKCWAQM